ncbi:unnamed protein product, partial [marine sediment metagenome]
MIASFRSMRASSSAAIQTKSEVNRLNVSREAILKDAAAYTKE